MTAGGSNGGGRQTISIGPRGIILPAQGPTADYTVDTGRPAGQAGTAGARPNNWSDNHLAPSATESAALAGELQSMSVQAPAVAASAISPLAIHNCFWEDRLACLKKRSCTLSAQWAPALAVFPLGTLGAQQGFLLSVSPISLLQGRLLASTSDCLHYSTAPFRLRLPVQVTLSRALSIA